MRDSSLTHIFRHFLVAISILIVIGCSSNPDSISTTSLEQLRNAIEENDIDQIFSLTTEFSHDKTLTKIEIKKALDQFRKKWLETDNIEIKKYLSPPLKISETSLVCEQEKNSCNLFGVVTYDSPQENITIEVSEIPYTRHIKEGKIVFQLIKAKGNVEFTHMEFDKVKPLAYFDDYDSSWYKSMYGDATGDMVRQIREWDANKILASKKLLVHLGLYSGPIDPMIRNDNYIAAISNAYYQYLEECENDKLSCPWPCKNVCILHKKLKENPLIPMTVKVDTVLYEFSSEDIQPEIRNLVEKTRKEEMERINEEQRKFRELVDKVFPAK